MIREAIWDVVWRTRYVVAAFSLVGSIVIATASSAQSTCSATSGNTNVCEASFMVKAGGSVVVASGATFWNRDCSFVPPAIETVIAPQKGHLVPSVVPSVIPSTPVVGSAVAACAGRPTKGLRLTYIANRSASGTDQVVLNIKSSTHQVKVTYNITVQ